MNNLKKLGLSALAGSLVAVSAQAGEISVSGSANVTMVLVKLQTQADHLVQTKTLRLLVQVN